jgi:hypothetical protein
MRDALMSLLGILTNILKAWAGMATPGNTRALWLALNPILAVTAMLSSHPALVQLFTYMYLAAKVAGPLGALFTTLKSGWGGVSKFLGLVTGGKVQLGMQSSGDTMLLAARQMQIAADTMLAASRGGVAGGAAGAAGKGAAGAEAGAGGAAAAAGSRMSLLARGGVIAGGALLAAGIAQYWKDAWTAGLKGAWGTVSQKISQWLGGIPGVLQSGAQGIISALSQRGGGLLGKLPLFGPVFAQVAKWYQDIKAAVAQGETQAVGWLTQTASRMWRGFITGAQSVWTGTVGPWLAQRGQAIVASVGQLGQILAPAGHAIMSGFHTGEIAHWAATIGPWLANLPGRALGLIPDLAGTLLAKGQSLINGLHLGAVQHWAAVIAPWLANLPGRALSAIPDLVGTLLGKGQSLISGLHSGITNFWNGTVSPWLAGLGGRSTGSVGDLAGTLLAKGQSLISGLQNGITNFWNGTVSPWLAGLPGRAAGAIGNVLGALVPGGTSLIQGLGNGITQRWGSVAGWLGGLGGRVAAAVGNLGGVLVNAGASAINGLWQGMQNAWGPVGTWLGSLKAAIPQIKGPLSEDLRLLYDNGVAIINGLWQGLQAQWPQVQSWLAQLKGIIAQIKGPQSEDIKILFDNGISIMQGLLEGLQNGFSGGVQPYLEKIGGWVQQAWQTIAGGSSAMAAHVGQRAADIAGRVLQQGHNLLSKARSVAAQINKGGTYSLGGFSVTIPPGLLSGGSVGNIASKVTSAIASWGGGFARGGMINEPVVGVGASGRLYRFGEAGTEAVSSQADLQDVAALLRAVLLELRALRKLSAVQPERTGQAVGVALNNGARRVALSRG